MLSFVRLSHIRIVPFDRRRAARSPALAAGVATQMSGEREAFNRGQKLANVTPEARDGLLSAEGARIADGAGARLRDDRALQRWTHCASPVISRGAALDPAWVLRRTTTTHQR